MAEALDTFSDLDFSDSDNEGDDAELNRQFQAAADHMKHLVSKLDQRKLLQIYALFKQATEGPCNISRPNWYEVQARKKWDAWNSIGDISSSISKERYISLITEIDPNWNTQSSPKSKEAKKKVQWVAVSSFSKTRESCSCGNIFDFCKTGDVANVKSILQKEPNLIKILDSNGLGLIHWAADRGLLDMIRLILDSDCDVHLKDSTGQTALHYAVSCGHIDCVKYLLRFGADKIAKDNDGITPIDLTTEDSVMEILMSD